MRAVRSIPVCSKAPPEFCEGFFCCFLPNYGYNIVVWCIVQFTNLQYLRSEYDIWFVVVFLVFASGFFVELMIK